MLSSRYASYLVYRRLQRLARKKYRESAAKRCRLLVWPPVTNVEELEDIVEWLAWYVPEQSGLNVSLVGTPDVMARGAARIAQRNVELSPRITDDVFETVLIRKDTLRNTLDALMRFNAKLECIDKQFFSYHESIAFQQIFTLHDTASLRGVRNRLEHESRRNYESVYSRYHGCRRAFVLGSGPSIQEIFKLDLTPDDLVIACNSLVKNHKLLAYVRPAIFTFADPVFHFGRSTYACRFREYVTAADSNMNFVCIVPPEHGLLLALHYPHLVPRLIVMPSGREFNLPTPSQRSVLATANIMTLYMLPIASAMAQEVYIVGADGRVESDHCFWKHDQDSQFGDLMKTAFDAHPSFFRDRDYKAYFSKHCNTMEAMITEGERRGIRYYSVSHSTVPALRQRTWAHSILGKQVVGSG